MPILNNEILDDQLTFDKCLEFTGGVNLAQTPNFIRENQVTEMENLQTVSSGIAETRPGTLSLGGAALAAAPIRGLSYFDIPTMKRLLAVCNGSLKSWNGSAWSALTGYTPSLSSLWVEMAQGVNRLYLSDGIGNVFSWDGATFTDEGNTNTDPPRGKYMQWFTGRLFVAGVESDPDTLFPSDLLNGSAFDRNLRSIRPGNGEGGVITGLRKWDKFNLIVAKENSIYNVIADPTITDFSEWQIDPIHESVGCVSHRSMCQVGTDIWFLAQDGVKSVRRLYQEQQNEVTTSISEPISPIIARINKAHFNKCSAVFWENKYLLSVPLDEATEPNYLLVYSTITKSWAGYWTRINAAGFAVTTFGNGRRLVFGDSAGKVRQLMDSSTDGIWEDDGADIPWAMTGRGFAFTELVGEKTGFNVEVKFYKSRAKATIEVILDQQSTQLIDSEFSTQDASLAYPITFPIKYPYTGVWKRAFDLMALGRFDMLQVRITGARGYVAVRSIIASAFIESMELQK